MTLVTTDPAATIPVERFQAGLLPSEDTGPPGFVLRLRAITSTGTGKLITAAATRKHLGQADLIVFKNGKPTGLRYDLSDVKVERVISAGTAGALAPREVLISLSPAKFEITHLGGAKSGESTTKSYDGVWDVTQKVDG